jgi:Magnesium transporter NIPA
LTYAATALAVVLLLIWGTPPEWGTNNVFVYLGICSLMGSLSVVSCKVPCAHRSCASVRVVPMHSASIDRTGQTYMMLPMLVPPETGIGHITAIDFQRQQPADAAGDWLLPSGALLLEVCVVDAAGRAGQCSVS